MKKTMMVAKKIPTRAVPFLFFFAKKEWKLLSATQLVNMGVVLHLFFLPVLLKELTDTLTQLSDRSQLWNVLFPIILVACSVLGLIQLLYFLSGVWGIRLVCRLEAQISLAFFQHLQGHSIPFFHIHSTGVMVNMLTQLVNRLPTFLEDLVENLIPALLSLFLALYLYGEIGPLLCLATAPLHHHPMPALAAFSPTVHRRRGTPQSESSHTSRQNHRSFHECVTGDSLLTPSSRVSPNRKGPEKGGRGLLQKRDGHTEHPDDLWYRQPALLLWRHDLAHSARVAEGYFDRGCSFSIKCYLEHCGDVKRDSRSNSQPFE